MSEHEDYWLRDIELERLEQKTKDDQSDRDLVVHVTELAMMTDEIRHRRALRLTTEEREALAEFVDDHGQPHAYGDTPIMRVAGVVALVRLLKATP